MKRSGVITVFLSMCFLSISALICVMVESARTAGSRYYFQVAVNGGLDTLFSRYHRRLWEEYRILAMEYGSEDELTGDISSYINKYLEVDNWYPMELESVEAVQLMGIGDAGGDYLAEEILSYMKYGAVSQLIIQPQEGEQVLKDVTEASGVGTLTGMYSGQEKEVRKLEQAVENLAANIKKQETYQKEIETALFSNDEGEFYEAAAKYRKAAGDYPRLMERYKKQADVLAERQKKSRREIDSIKPDLQEDREELLERQWNPYDAYIEQDGERYRELSGQEKAAAKNLDLLEEVEMLVEELLERNEEDEEDDEEEEIWLEPAARVWSEQYENSKVNVDSSSGDKEKQNLLDRIQQMVQGSLAELVMPKGTVISQAVTPAGALPSAKSGTGERGGSLSERVLIDEYCGHFFLNAVKGGDRRLQYETEYILQGNRTDRENLEKTVTELFVVREGMNLIHILSDSAKREQARTLALAITGSAGLAPLVEIAACLIMGVWAMGEAIQDLRILMSGGKVPLWKQREDWHVSLEGLLDMGRGQMPDIKGQNEGQKGFSYEGYLKLLLLKENPGEKHMRILDLLEINIRQAEPGFSISQCAYRVDICGKACGKHVFFALPFVENIVNGEKGYPLEAIAEKAY